MYLTHYECNLWISIAGIYFPTDKDALEAAVETGIKIWATGMENLYVDQETNPKPGYNVSLVPTLNCQEKVQMHWQDGRLLYKWVAFVFYAICGNLLNMGHVWGVLDKWIQCNQSWQTWWSFGHPKWRKCITKAGWAWHATIHTSEVMTKHLKHAPYPRVIHIIY